MKTLLKRQYQSFIDAQQQWEEEDINWKICVSLGQAYSVDPPHPDDKILKGWLHDPRQEAMEKTRGGGEPSVDPDRWIQYCVKNPEWLGYKMIFIEFALDSDEWDNNPDDIDDDISTLWKNHVEGHVRSPRSLKK